MPGTTIIEFAPSGPGFEDQGGKCTLSFITCLSGEGASTDSKEVVPSPVESLCRVPGEGELEEGRASLGRHHLSGGAEQTPPFLPASLILQPMKKPEVSSEAQRGHTVVSLMHLLSVCSSKIAALGTQINLTFYSNYFIFHLNAGEYRVMGPRRDLVSRAKPQRLL